MKPIQDMRWTTNGRNVVDHGGEQVATCFGTHGAEVAQAFAALPKVVRALLESGASRPLNTQGQWHTGNCWRWASGRIPREACTQDCAVAREAFAACGVDVG